MKTLVAILSLVSAFAWADQYNDTTVVTCTGAQELGMSTISILQGDAGLYARVGMYPMKNITFAAVEKWDTNKYFINNEFGTDYVLVKSWTGKWNLSDTAAEQNYFIEIDCQ